MRIGVPKEVKTHEYRVALTPEGARVLAAEGHEVRVQAGAGEAAGFGDRDYEQACARVVATAAEAWDCDLLVKVKEPQPAEVPLLRRGQILFCYLHLAAEPRLARSLLASGAACVAYETVADARGQLPLLVPMSQVAGRLATQAGAWALTRPAGGSGVLLAGVPGVPPGRVTIVGGGVVGSNAARIALGLGADTTILDRSGWRLRQLEDVFGPRLRTAYSTPDTLAAAVREADLAVGAVLLPGRRAPRLIPRSLVASMRPGSVLVDVSIDQGGCAETSRPTSHADPLYVEEGVLHYCVTNMPGAVPRTSTLALSQATLPYVRALAGSGLRDALLADPGLMAGLQAHAGRLTHRGLAEDLALEHTAPEQSLRDT